MNKTKFSFSQLRHPIIQAPMAGGVNTPELVSAVINNGAVGSYGFAYSKPKQIIEDIKSAKNLLHHEAKGALNCNFFVFPEKANDPGPNDSSAVAALNEIEFCRDLNIQDPDPPYAPSLRAQLESVWDDPPRILTFHFGIPQIDMI